MNFFKVALDELSDGLSEEIRYNALSTRLSKLDNDDFKELMNDVTPTEGKAPIIVDHAAQMRMAQGH